MEGIFRVSPQFSELKEIMDALERGLISLSTVESPHVVSGLIKQFLRDSPEPLLTFDLFDKWITATGNPLISFPYVNGPCQMHQIRMRKTLS